MAQTQDLEAYLSRASVAPEVFALRPDYRALLIAISGIPTGPSDASSEDMLASAEAHARSAMESQAVNDIPHVAAWRDAYKAFGSKPNKFRNSLEALTRRISAPGKEPATGLPRVNRLTDIYNAISVKHQIPLGGEDLDKYEGAPVLVRAKGTEVFATTANGETVEEHPDVGEVVWCDDAGVTCRRWNWRQGPRTALTDQTTKVLFILDALKPCDDAALQKAGDELVEALRQLSSDISVEKRLLKAD
jgi:DNA/RNA-binding domain of Phe-tRNA-synthetase-like protein